MYAFTVFSPLQMKQRIHIHTNHSQAYMYVRTFVCKIISLFASEDHRTPQKIASILKFHCITLVNIRTPYTNENIPIGIILSGLQFPFTYNSRLVGIKCIFPNKLLSWLCVWWRAPAKLCHSRANYTASQQHKFKNDLLLQPHIIYSSYQFNWEWL